ncbi:hypothetical protein [Pseudoalteromonas luteoviolacea]|uniref:Uncharacterized protein n=1 Tax=Pseudoalteromonas luteoviolacea H33 TaxID=1365251 RepID=A0A161Y5N3_9GAMM|nr:hypothetical protein [Pseudoalteromonas luteoviolacea]KZN50881.1 hypothetical protein N476_14665 [Pseudoalteromonas luteoviolacea H33]KZN74955.1 hypothetical protein N477_20305 [Pseudoalteromonas luteoviolacea H33-S]MBQ4879844.1 hypothetical protein [Pseudoalteromonas luteoviolacea]MBQ4908606.1 hypothetical protein [Pseudoalteromonas luteoviolacea]
MKINASAGPLLHAKNNQVSDEMRNIAPSSQEGLKVDPTKQFINSEPTHPAEQMRAKSDNGKLTVITYKANGRLDLPARYEEHRGILESAIISTSKLYLHETPAAANRIAEEYEKVSADLYEQNPRLKNKSWGFTVDETGKLVATGHLNQADKQLVEEALNSNEELVSAAKDFKTSFLEGLEIERGSAGTSQYWGKYDVNEGNFAQIIDFKEMIEQGSNDEIEREKRGYLLNKWEWTINISDQLQARAEPTFAK